jgi:hypothetical protein
MRARACISTLVTLVALGHAAVAAGQAGGSYAMTIDHGKPIALSSLDFGESNAGNGPGPGKKFSPVTVTVGSGAEAVGSIVSGCIENKVFHLVEATFTNAQGQVQFEVQFKNAVVSSLTLPAVDTSSTPPADMTWVFTVESELVGPPSTSAAPPSVKMTLPRMWHSNMQRLSAARAGKFSLKIQSIDTTGVLTASPFMIARLAQGGPLGKANYTPLTLTVDAGKAADFTNWLQGRKRVTEGNLAYNRKTDSGQEEAILLLLRHLSIKSCDFVGSAGSAPFYKVVLDFDEVAVSTSATPVGRTL